MVQMQKIPTLPIVPDEQILVVRVSELFKNGRWQGLWRNPEPSFFDNIFTQRLFIPRAAAENDPTYKQIIPYLVFRHEDSLFLMQRQAKTRETRLQSRFSLGIGGHIRETDIIGTDIAGWAKREFEEEVAYNGTFTIKPLGALNDDSNEVGMVHLGIVYLLEGDSPNINVKEELASGKLLPIAECEHFYHRMEEWSRIVYTALRDTV